MSTVEFGNYKIHAQQLMVDDPRSYVLVEIEHKVLDRLCFRFDMTPEQFRVFADWIKSVATNEVKPHEKSV